MKTLPLFLCLLSLPLLGGCNRHSSSAGEPSAEAPETSPSATVYRVRGIVRKIADGGAMAVIDHEEIPDYMAAMSMPFYPKEPALFAELKPGQQIEFDYHVDGTKSWVENITVLVEAQSKEG